MTALVDRPARLLLRLHLRRLSGLVRLRGRGLDVQLWVRNQELWAAAGVPNLFGTLSAQVPDQRALQGDLFADLPVLLAMGIGLDQASLAVADSVGLLLAEASLDPEISAEFEAEVSPPAGCFALGRPLLRHYALALAGLRSASQVADELAGWSAARMRVEDAVGEDLAALGPIAIRTLALARRNRVLGDLVRVSGRGQLQRTQQSWVAVDLLRQLGLIRIQGVPSSQRPASLSGLVRANASSGAEPGPPPSPKRRPKPTPAPRTMPSGLAVFAQGAGMEEAFETVEIEELGGAWSARPGAVSVQAPSVDDSVDDEGGTEPLPQWEIQDDEESFESEELERTEMPSLELGSETGPLVMGEDPEDFEDDEDSWESLTGPMEMASDEDEDAWEQTGPMEMAEDDDFEEDSYGEDSVEEAVFAEGELESALGRDVTLELGPMDEDSHDLDYMVEGIAELLQGYSEKLQTEEEMLAGPMLAEEQDEGGFLLDDVGLEDPALPGLRRKLEQLRRLPPLELLGLTPKQLSEHNWARGELAPFWQNSRSTWLPKHWRGASAEVQAVAEEILTLLDDTHIALEHAPIFASALARSWEGLPKRPSRTAEALVLRAQRLCGNAKWEEALEILDKARVASPTSIRAILLQLYAQVVTRALHVHDATAWAYAVTLQTDKGLRSQGAYTAGRLLERAGAKGDALACYRAAARNKPDHKPTSARLDHLAASAPGKPSALGRLFLDAVESSA